jgi:hypothetical protein
VALVARDYDCFIGDVFLHCVPQKSVHLDKGIGFLLIAMAAFFRFPSAEMNKQIRLG